MSTKNSNTSQELFNLNGKPSFGQALPLAFQHVVAMIIGCVAPAIILAGVSGLSESDTVVLIQASLAMSAISTFIQLFPFIKRRCRRGRYTMQYMVPKHARPPTS